MKNKLFLLTVLALSLIFMVTTVNIVSADTSCNPTIQIVNQDPIPAVPNDYVKVIIEVSNLVNCNKFAVDLNPKYPFSLDPGTDPIQVLEQTPYSLNYKSSWDIPYTIRVAPDAIDGSYGLNLLYHEGNSKDFTTNYAVQALNLSIVGSQTDFATVIQGVSGNQVSIGIVNIGKNTANSLIVSIPQQQNYQATGTTQQIVGNLNAGDYSIVTFTVNSRITGGAGRNFTRTGTAGQQNPNSENFNASSNIPNPNNPGVNFANQTIRLQLDYTDGIGVRRSITKEIPFSLSSFSSGNLTGSGNFSRRTTTASSGLSIWWYIGGIIVILVILYIVYRKYGDNMKHFFKKKHNEKSSRNTPEWVAAERTHNKK